MTELIITEKPNAAQKVALALADSKPQKESKNTVPFYRLKHNGKDIIVASAVGHLFTVGETEKSPWSMFPIFDVRWIPTADADKSAAYSRKYLNVLKQFKKEVDELTVACDYDIEGEVIGLNVIREIFGAKDANRMKFSTLTKPDLIKAYENKLPTLDWGQANAGETRHILDFFYGINLTRALTHSINSAINGFKVLSSGRVQGPALKIIVDREKEIRSFVPVPFWQIELNGKIKSYAINAMHKEDKFWEKEKADKVMQNVEGQKQGKISDTQKRQFNQSPPFPFDLTSMQLEAYRCFKIKPKATLEVAQRLYTEGYISYPRTSSQKLPQQIGYQKILQQLKSQEIYAHLAQKLLNKKDLKPNEGKKTDDAHPAIYPTGIIPDSLDDYDAKIYDLIVKRFFAVFADPAKRETNTITIDVNTEPFIAKGTVTIEKGWHEFYSPYVKLEEMELPIVSIGDDVIIDDITQLSKETKPPNRYTQSSIIHALEKKSLGTKATRAAIVDTLFQRGYVTGDSNIEATELGIRTVDTLVKYSPDIVDEELTRHFEEEMEKIRQKQLTPDQVITKAKEILVKIIDTFKKNEKEVGKELADANTEAVKIATTLGRCRKCGQGDIIIRNGKFGKFAACNNYPDCKTTYNLPKTGTLKPADEDCTECGMPLIEVKLPKKSPQKICINPDCPTKKAMDENGNIIEAEKKYDEEGMLCPVCAKGKMALRQSFYGQFLGCDNYPKCKTMMRIVNGKVDTTPIAPIQKKKSAKKKKSATKKATKKATNKSAKKAVKKTTKKTTKKAKAKSSK